MRALENAAAGPAVDREKSRQAVRQNCGTLAYGAADLRAEREICLRPPGGPNLKPARLNQCDEAGALPPRSTATRESTLPHTPEVQRCELACAPK